MIRRRRRHHRRHQKLTPGSGRTKEIAFVTLLALAILFGILYYLLPHYQGHGDESGQGPGGAAPALSRSDGDNTLLDSMTPGSGLSKVRAWRLRRPAG
ncbi:MAG TPA: hypothetical protein VFH68_08790 [Polyangia bacterium]|nr:hypothetical protein [Polyangia bacterium]